MAEGSSVHDHCIQMLSFVEKLEDLKSRMENDTYISVFLQSLLPSYDPFIVNFNMNGLEKSILELINMWVQFKATINRSVPAVTLGETSTSKKVKKARGVGRRRKAKLKVQSMRANQLSRARLLTKERGRRFLKLVRQKIPSTSAMKRVLEEDLC
ncbi:UNVERIFIED_CONTAM: hypothetical protein Slati_0833700 [Sesamum latifolium]|uniref:Uncharacterized protein n=1 Tax=Sesamum latifolium TaxID=2727402 RepID=A0AAW2XLS3_9LAMI